MIIYFGRKIYANLFENMLNGIVRIIKESVSFRVCHICLRGTATFASNLSI